MRVRHHVVHPVGEPALEAEVQRDGGEDRDEDGRDQRDGGEEAHQPHVQLRAGRAPPAGGDHLGDPPGHEGGDDQRIDEVGEQHRAQHVAAAEPLHLGEDREGGDGRAAARGPPWSRSLPAAGCAGCASAPGGARRGSVRGCAFFRDAFPARLLPSYIILLPRVTRMSRSLIFFRSVFRLMPSSSAVRTWLPRVAASESAISGSSISLRIRS